MKSVIVPPDATAELPRSWCGDRNLHTAHRWYDRWVGGPKSGAVRWYECPGVSLARSKGRL